MGKVVKKPPQSILEEILDETFNKLDENEDFDSKLILELKSLFSEGSIKNEQNLIFILRGESSADS